MKAPLSAHAWATWASWVIVQQRTGKAVSSGNLWLSDGCSCVRGWIKRVRGNESAQRGGGGGVDARLRCERETVSSVKEQLRCQQLLKLTLTLIQAGYTSLF